MTLQDQQYLELGLTLDIRGGMVEIPVRTRMSAYLASTIIIWSPLDRNLLSENAMDTTDAPPPKCMQQINQILDLDSRGHNLLVSSLRQLNATPLRDDGSVRGPCTKMTFSIPASTYVGMRLRHSTLGLLIPALLSRLCNVEACQPDACHILA